MKKQFQEDIMWVALYLKAMTFLADSQNVFFKSYTIIWFCNLWYEKTRLFLEQFIERNDEGT